MVGLELHHISESGHWPPDIKYHPSLSAVGSWLRDLITDDWYILLSNYKEIHWLEFEYS